MVLQGRRCLSENRRVDVSGQTGAAVLLHRQIWVVSRRVCAAAGVCRSDDLWVEPAAGADLFDNARPIGTAEMKAEIPTVCWGHERLIGCRTTESFH